MTTPTSAFGRGRRWCGCRGRAPILVRCRRRQRNSASWPSSAGASGGSDKAAVDALRGNPKSETRNPKCRDNFGFRISGFGFFSWRRGMSVVAYVALGSNLGERQSYLDQALTALRDHPVIKVRRVSTFIETDPVGGPAGQGRYLNGVAEIETTLSAEELLRFLLQVEQSLGRVREERFGPRTIDLDLLLYGTETREGRELTLPHPRMHEREFVLVPLVEIAPDVVHPELGRTARELLEELRRSSPSPRSAAVPSRELAGRRALVTGSTSGIGRAIALELADAGANVVIHGRRSFETAVEVHKQVEAKGVKGGFILANVAEPEQCDILCDGPWEEWNGID